MKRLRIQGIKELQGTICVSGAKNSAVALIPASLLSDGIVKITNVPNISDIDALNEILTYLGANVRREDGSIEIDATSIENKEIPESISTKLRASYYFMGALLGKYKTVSMYFPGGCSIGKRPIDQTLKGFEALGATIEEKDNKYKITAQELVGTHIYLDMVSVGATVNIMLAAVRAKGTTIIENVAKEPEIVNVATFLNNMGAKIKGAGTDKITIVGVNELTGCNHEVIPDRIEAGTFVILGALAGNPVRIENLIPEHIEALLLKLREIGVNLTIGKNYVEVKKTDQLKPVRVKTLVYPGLATDLQQPLTTLLTQIPGVSYVEETIYENRYMHIPELNKLGTDIEMIDNRNFKITGKTPLKGTEVNATDLRGGAALVLAAIIADGETVVNQVEHVLRGYENIVEKLEGIGAKIKIEEI